MNRPVSKAPKSARSTDPVSFASVSSVLWHTFLLRPAQTSPYLVSVLSVTFVADFLRRLPAICAGHRFGLSLRQGSPLLRETLRTRLVEQIPCQTPPAPKIFFSAS